MRPPFLDRDGAQAAGSQGVFQKTAQRFEAIGAGRLGAQQQRKGRARLGAAAALVGHVAPLRLSPFWGTHLSAKTLCCPLKKRAPP